MIPLAYVLGLSRAPESYRNSYLGDGHFLGLREECVAELMGPVRIVPAQEFFLLSKVPVAHWYERKH